MSFNKEFVPLSSSEVWLAAAELVASHNSDASAIAARRARVCIEIGAIEERRTWLRVLAAVKALVESLPPAEGGSNTASCAANAATAAQEAMEKGVQNVD